jgi:hypothetical protein
MQTLTYEYGKDNIFDFCFMEDFTTVALANEEYNIDISNLNYQDEDDFYCFSKHKIYTKKELFEKFDIKEIL